MTRRAMAPSAEAGSFGFRRASASGAIKTGDASLSGALGWQRATGIDSFGAPGGDKDGYRNLSGRVRGTAALGPDVRARRCGVRLHRPTPSSTATTRSPSSTPIRSTTAATGSPRAASGPSSEARNRRGADGSARRCSARRTAITLRASRSTGPAARGARSTRSSSAASQPAQVAAPADPRRRSRTRDIPRSRHSAPAFDRPGPQAARTRRSPPSGVRRTRRVYRRRRGPPRLLQPLQGRDDASRFAAQPSSAAASRWPAPTPRAWPSRPSSTSTAFFPDNFVGNPNRLGRKARAASKGRFVSADRRFNASLTGLSAAASRRNRRRRSTSRPSCRPRATAPPSAIAPGSRPRLAGSCRRPAAAQRQLRLPACDRSRTPCPACQVTERRRPKHSGSVEADGSERTVELRSARSLTSDRTSIRWRLRRSAWFELKLLLAGRTRASLTALRPGIELFARGSNLFDANYQEVAGYHTEGLGVFAGIRLASR